MTIETTEIGSTAIDSDRWPDVARVPRRGLSAVIADRLARRAAARLPVRLVYPDGMVVGAADPTLPTMVIHQPGAFARRIGRYGLIGFGESYMAGEWSSDDPVGLLNEFAKSVNELDSSRVATTSARLPSYALRVPSTTAEPRRAATSPSTTTSPTNCSRSSSTRP